MPTIITHAVVGAVSAKVFTKQIEPWRIWIPSIFCSVIPDADVIAFSFGIPYGHFLGHRGFFHSILFALVLSLIVVLYLFRDVKLFSKNWWSYLSLFFIVGVSHGVLDAITNGGLGIALLSPFDTTRYFFSWRPLQVSPIGLSAFMSRWGLRVLICEMIYIWLPLSLMLIARHITKYLFLRRQRQKT
jgi:inner membrane protein